MLLIRQEEYTDYHFGLVATKNKIGYIMDGGLVLEHVV
jgi:hypothetical protein